jgi:bifunctional non-homologous end joining protein LigD
MQDLFERYPDLQLATLVEAPPEGDGWLHEIKYDAYRLLAFLDDRKVRLLTRNRNDWTVRFPSIQASVGRLKARSAVLDVEAAIVEPTGRTDFHALQQALSEFGDSRAIVGYAFDLLHLDGTDLSGCPQIERKEKLQTLLEKSTLGNQLYYSEHVRGSGAAELKKACRLGLEGIVSKFATAPYRTGRQKTWLKSKCLTRQEFIILGFSAAKSGDRAIGALYLGYRRDGEIAYAGKVGTGFTTADATVLLEKMSSLETKTPSAKGVPRSELRAIHWVKPKLLCEVVFVEWTKDGYIRHPSFQGLREDKQARSVRRETPAALELTAPSAEKRSEK